MDYAQFLICRFHNTCATAPGCEMKMLLISRAFNMFLKLASNPRRLFLIDAIGALVTMMLLLLIQQFFQEYFRMPSEILLVLIVVAAVFCLYSTGCSFFARSQWRLFLGVIITLNLLYCLLILVFVIYCFQQLTVFGKLYFLGEGVVISALVYVEVKVLFAAPERI